MLAPVQPTVGYAGVNGSINECVDVRSIYLYNKALWGVFIQHMQLVKSLGMPWDLAVKAMYFIT